MNIHPSLRFLSTAVATGLAAAFIILLVRGQLPGLGSTPPAPQSYAPAVDAAAPSVVNIYATKFTEEGPPAVFDDPFFQRFFGTGNSKPRIRREQSLGSGVIVDREGYVLTNNHVIEGASEVAVLLDNGQQLTSRVIGTDPDTDLAVLQVAEAGLPVARVGRSGQLRVGDVVLAIGNPFGVGQTVTLGIISATGRSQLGLAQEENFIQTDAAINPGNSGGALINARGEVIGINTAIFSRSGGSQGIGFAIPSELALAVMREIVRHGRVIRGWLGISGRQLTPALAKAMNLPVEQGVLVAASQPGGPAAEAGIVPGDVIVGANGEPTRDVVALMNWITSRPPGTKVTLDVVHAGSTRQVEVVILERPRQKNQS